MQQQLDEFRRHLVRRGDQRRVDEAAPAHGVPKRDRADPRRESQQKASRATRIHSRAFLASFWQLMQSHIINRMTIQEAPLGR